MSYCEACGNEAFEGGLEIKTCHRVDCGFQWVMTDEYMECPRCELRELRDQPEGGALRSAVPG